MPTEDQPSAAERPPSPERIEERSEKALTGSGQLQRDPIQAQSVAFQEIQPAGVPVIQAQAAPADTSRPPPEGSDKSNE